MAIDPLLVRRVLRVLLPMVSVGSVLAAAAGAVPWAVAVMLGALCVGTMAAALLRGRPLLRAAVRGLTWAVLMLGFHAALDGRGPSLAEATATVAFGLVLVGGVTYIEERHAPGERRHAESLREAEARGRRT